MRVSTGVPLQVVSKPGLAPDELNSFSADSATARVSVPVSKRDLLRRSDCRGEELIHSKAVFQTLRRAIQNGIILRQPDVVPTVLIDVPFCTGLMGSLGSESIPKNPRRDVSVVAPFDNPDQEQQSQRLFLNFALPRAQKMDIIEWCSAVVKNALWKQDRRSGSRRILMKTSVRREPVAVLSLPLVNTGGAPLPPCRIHFHR